MQLATLTLQAFRSYAHHQLQFEKKVTVFIGPNAIGKTSLIEAVDLLARATSFRATKIEDMIQFGAELSRVSGKLMPETTNVGAGKNDDDNTDEDILLEIILTNGVVQGAKTQKRLYSVNGVRRRRRDFLGKLYTVVFRPEDMRLIEGSPSRRRNFLDTPLAMINPTYDTALTTYEKALRQTNSLLEHIRDNRAPIATLTYWNNLLLKHGGYIQEQRRQFAQFINTVGFSLPFSFSYQPSIINSARLNEYHPRALAAGHMLIGPHKDDFVVSLQTEIKHAPEIFDIANFGSRGQQRMAVLWLKIAEQAYLQQTTQQQPILLLDDILSELDPIVRSKVLSLLPSGQAIITSADATILPEITAAIPASDLQLIEL